MESQELASYELLGAADDRFSVLCCESHHIDVKAALADNCDRYRLRNYGTLKSGFPELSAEQVLPNGDDS